jgi:hypothetical protein
LAAWRSSTGQKLTIWLSVPRKKLMRGKEMNKDTTSAAVTPHTSHSRGPASRPKARSKADMTPS